MLCEIGILPTQHISLPLFIFSMKITTMITFLSKFGEEKKASPIHLLNKNLNPNDLGQIEILSHILR
jgi:hypothetical protein